MRAGQFERAFPGLGATIAKEDAVQAGALGKLQRQLRLALVKEEIRGVDELAALPDDGLFDGRMAVAERVNADAAQQVEIALALLVDEVHTLSASEKNGIAVVGGKQQLGFGCANFIESVQFKFSWSVCPADR